MKKEMYKFYAYKRIRLFWFLTYTRNRDMQANFP